MAMYRSSTRCPYWPSVCGIGLCACYAMPGTNLEGRMYQYPWTPLLTWRVEWYQPVADGDSTTDVGGFGCEVHSHDVRTQGTEPSFCLCLHLTLASIAASTSQACTLIYVSYMIHVYLSQ
eukprot:1372005-Rhodomonas_salina.2